jgi:coproporphyrinogen III oxidase-like Fe-S oxidoreductase
MYFFFQNIRSAENISIGNFSRTYLCRMAGIYIHIPFCKKACHYCDFHFSTSPQYKEQMLNALRTEIILRKNYLNNEKIETIYSLLIETD